MFANYVNPLAVYLSPHDDVIAKADKMNSCDWYWLLRHCPMLLYLLGFRAGRFLIGAGFTRCSLAISGPGK